MDRWRERNQHSLVTLSLSSPRRENKRAKYKKKRRGRKEGSRNKTDGWTAWKRRRPRNSKHEAAKQASKENLFLSLSVRQDGRTYGGPQWWLLFSLARFKGESDMCSIFRHWPVFVSLSSTLMDSLAPPSPRPPPTKPLLFLTGVFSSTPL